MSKTTTNEPVTRLACRIAASAARNRCQSVADAVRASSRTLESHWETVQRQQCRAAKAIDRGWFLAARRVLGDHPATLFPARQSTPSVLIPIE